MLFNFFMMTFSLLLLLFYVKWKNVSSYWARLGITYIPPHPLWGNLTFLYKLNMSTWMLQVYRRFKAPYVGIWLFWKPALIINCPNLVRNILVKDSINFRNKHLSSGRTDPIGSLNILMIKDPYWTKIRQRLSGAFTSSKLKGVHTIAHLKSMQLIERIENDKDIEIDLRMLLTDYTTDIFSISSFGVASDSVLKRESPIREITKDLMKFSIHRSLSWWSIFFWPELVDIFRFTFLPKYSTEYFRKVFEVIAAQKDCLKDPKNLIDYILELRNLTINGEALTEDHVVAQAAIFLIGGFDTSGSALTFLIYQMAWSPETQEKLFDELASAKNSNDGELDTSVSELPYTNCIIKETLRLFAPMAWLDRIALNDYQVDDNLTIKAGTPVYINGSGMQMDPNYFPEPEIFDPDRFLPENECNIKPYTYLPFGDGPRFCIGQRFGMIILRCAIAAIFLNYKLEPLPNTPKPSDVKFDKRAIFIVPGEKLKVKFIPRKETLWN